MVIQESEDWLTIEELHLGMAESVIKGILTSKYRAEQHTVNVWKKIDVKRKEEANIASLGDSQEQ